MIDLEQRWFFDLGYVVFVFPDEPWADILPTLVVPPDPRKNRGEITLNNAVHNRRLAAVCVRAFERTENAKEWRDGEPLGENDLEI
jgi:hypothetical protein